MSNDTPTRRWCQFSLKTLLLFVAAFSMVMATLSYCHRYWYRELSFDPAIAQELPSAEFYEMIGPRETTNGIKYHGSDDKYHFIHQYNALSLSGNKNYKVRRSEVEIKEVFSVGEDRYMLSRVNISKDDG